MRCYEPTIPFMLCENELGAMFRILGLPRGQIFVRHLGQLTTVKLCKLLFTLLARHFTEEHRKRIFYLILVAHILT